MSPGPSWGYRGNSLFDLAVVRAKNSIVLRDHHRSHADIINFSNTHFYEGKLQVATDYRRLKRPDGPAIRWVNVTGNVVRPPSGSAINQAEALAVVEELRKLAILQRFDGEIGVVTPFRAQANLIKELVARDNTLAPVLASHNFMAETAHAFQGDERDLIMLSPVVSRGTPVGATGFLKGQLNVFNVAITRARGALVVVGDAAACQTSGVKFLSDFAKYVNGSYRAAEHSITTLRPQRTGKSYPAVARPELVSDWEKMFYAALVDAEIYPVPQFNADQYLLDFALIRPNGRRLNIEIDGEQYHRDWNGELLRSDQLRNLRLIEMGWDVMRLWVYEVRDNLPECVRRVALWVKKADTLPDVSESLSPLERSLISISSLPERAQAEVDLTQKINDEQRPEDNQIYGHRRAAGQGDLTAQFNLGRLYATGTGVPLNYAEAAKWYRLAAQRGHVEAQYNLGFLYERAKACRSITSRRRGGIAARQIAKTRTRSPS